MSWYQYGGDRRADHARVLLEILKRRRKGEPFVPVEAATARGAICTTFWGQAWCRNLEHYSDYENRLPRGRTYLRGGHVYDLEISEGFAFAYVAGTGLYEVEIRIDPLKPARWKRLRKEVAGRVDNLVDLLGGRLGPGVMEVVTDPATGLFPAPKEIHINCSCPDWAVLCKHAAAVLYGIGTRFDRQPELFFTLRGIDHAELVAAAGNDAARLVDAGGDPSAGILTPDQLGELFGIEIAEPESAFLDDL